MNGTEQRLSETLSETLIDGLLIRTPKVKPVTTETFSNYITEETKQLSVEVKSKVTKTIGIYPGRFQPAGIHHYKTYEWLQKQFKDAWVATSNKVDGVKSPLNFREKRMVWLKHGVKNVKQVKNPYVCEEIVSKYDAEKTAVVFIFGAKDAGRLKTTKADGSPAYYQPYKENKNNLKGYEEHGYFIVAPHVSIKVLGKEVNGTRIRELLGSPKYDKETKIKAFEELFGWYDEKIFNYLTKKFGTLFENEEIVNEFIKAYPKLEDTLKSFPKLLKEISSTRPLGKGMVDDGPAVYYPGKSYETSTTNRARQLGYDVIDFVVGKHGVGRIADFRTWGEYAGPVPSVSFFPAGIPTESTPNNQLSYEKSKQAHHEWTEFIQGVAETVGYKIVDFLQSDISIRKKDEHGDEELVSVHVIDKDASDKPNDDEIDKGVEGHSIKETVESILQSCVELITEGGAAGHMNHPFDDMELTFDDMKEIVRRTLSGELNIEEEVTEKLDGMNLMFSWRDGKLISARNKTQLKNGAAEAPDAKAFEALLSDRPENIRDAFGDAIRDLEVAIGKLSDKQRHKIFKNGRRFMNIEVMSPKTQNVIPINSDMLVFHGTVAYDMAGVPTDVDDEGNNITAELKASAKTLDGMLRQISADVQSRYSIHAPIAVHLPKSKDFAESQKKFNGMIDALQREFRLSGSDEVTKYHETWWKNFLDKQLNKFKEVIPSTTYTGIVNRWAFGATKNESDLRNIRKELKSYPKTLAWVNKFDKDEKVSQIAENMWPFQFIFLKLGAEIMKNVRGFCSASGKDTLVKALDAHIKMLEGKKKNKPESTAKFIADMNKFDNNMKKFYAIGGLEDVVASEGIVFWYKGKLYKLTGLFAPANQVYGIGRF